MLQRFFHALSIVGLLAVAAFVATPFSASAQEQAKPAAAAKTSAFTDAQKAELQAIMKQFVLDNPQSLITSVETYYNKQNDTKVAQEGKVEQIPAGLYDGPNTPYAGNKDAKFVIVEFFDYNCGYCKQVSRDLQRLIDEDNNVKYVFKELPILSETSEVAARHALAANIQGKYLPFHMGMMQHQGPVDMGVIENVAKEAGIDVAKLKKDADTQDVRDSIAKNMELARTLGIRGTPFFLIGKEKVPGAVGYTKMKEMILKERDGIIVPDAPSDTSGAAAEIPAGAYPTGSSDEGSATKAAVDEAKKETGAMIDDLQKKADAMQKQAEEMMKKAEEAQKAQQAAKPAVKK